MKIDLALDDVEKTLIEKEKKLDSIVSEGRKTVRYCSLAIRSIHAGDLDQAKKHLAEAEKELSQLSPYRETFRSHLDHIYQEYAEARIVLSAVESQKIPSFKDLDIPEEPYLTALFDAIGELKREMYESLRKGDKGQAEKYFAMMEGIYDALIPIRFSNAILHDFRRKQDAARHQIEQARGELL